MSDKSLTNGNLALNNKKVIVIEAAKKPAIQKLRVAAYARVSSDSADQINSFVAQTNYYATLITSKKNWTLVDIYADEGITGTSVEKRLDFQRLISDCRNGHVDRILVKSISRFARNTKECLETIRELKSIGVSVFFEEQGIDTAEISGELMSAMFASIAQSESESISGNMRWSYKHRMESGTFLPSSVPFGYKIENKSIVIDEGNAEIVRQIFRDYLAGVSMDEIAAQLNRDKIPTKNGDDSGKWRNCSISYILSNERYIGDSLWQKTYTTDTLPSQKRRNYGEREQYFVQGTHPPILDTDTFYSVQELKKKRGARTKNQMPPNILSKTIFCSECGSMFKKRVCQGKAYWVCQNHYNGKSNCQVTQIQEEEIHAAFLRLYHKLKLHGESILLQLISDLQAVRERRMLWSIDIIELNKRISDISDQNRMLTEMNKLGLVDSDIFISQSNELAAQLRAAKQEKERLIGSNNDDTIPKTKELLEILESAPSFIPSFDEDLFCELVEKITATNEGTLRFHIKNGLTINEKAERGL